MSHPNHVDTAMIDRLAGGASVNLIGRAVGRGLLLLSQVIIARYLGPSAFGLYAIGWALLRVTGVITPLGMDQAVIHFGSRFHPDQPDQVRDVVRHAISATAITSMVAGALIFVCARWLGEEVYHQPDLVNVLMWFSPAITLYAVLRVSAASTRVSQSMIYSVLSEDVAQPAICLLLLMALVVPRDLGLSGVVVSTGLSMAAGLAISFTAVRRLWPGRAAAQTRHSGTPYRDLFAFSVPASLAGVFVILNSWAAQLLMGTLLPSSEVGVYQAAAQLSLVFTILLSAFNAVLSPMIANFFHKGDHRRLETLYSVGTKWGISLSLPLFLIVMFSSSDIMTVIYGLDYSRGWSVLLILTLGQMVNVCSGAVGILLIMTGHHRRWSILTGVMLLLNVALIFALARPYGILGAATATAISTAGIFLGGLLSARRLLALWPYDRRYLKTALAAVAAALVLAIIGAVNISSPIARILVNGLIAVSVTYGVLYSLGLDQEESQFLELARAVVSRVTRVWS